MNNGWQGGRLSRRRLALALPLLGAVAWGLPGMARAAGPQRASRNLMGTRVDIVADGGDARQLQAAIGLAFEEMQRLEGLLSRYREDSAVRRIGQAAGRHPVAVAPEVMAVLVSAQRVWQGSAGAFDPTVGALSGWHFEPGRQAMPAPAEIAAALRHVGARQLRLDERAGTAYLAEPGMALDLGGIAKLPILAAGLRVLEREGVTNALINGGGDVLASGRLQGRPWRVGVRDPRAPDRLLGAIEVEGHGVVASSGDYERGFVHQGRRLHHVLDPHNGWPTTGVHGVALLARDVQAVNGWGTALMVQGMAAVPAWSARHPGVAVLAAGADGVLWQSRGMTQALKPIDV
ncbi:MAG: FAD:protein FMN transferase [Proteobacteria bacterium]|nr:FAD:protein FMN transferase [Pseudomonadota bacterium]MBS0607993.1 FAD:protein FMN transferase [Pseudomonadota bacterium]